MARSERRAKRRGGNRGGGGGTTREVVTLNGRKFNPPLTKEWWTKDGDKFYARLVPNLTGILPVHGLVNKNNLGDLTVLHPLRRRFPHFSEHPCLFDEDAGPSEFDTEGSNFKPSTFWRVAKQGSSEYEDLAEYAGLETDTCTRIFVLGHPSRLADAEVLVFEFEMELDDGETSIEYEMEYPAYLSKPWLVKQDAEDFDFSDYWEDEDQKYPDRGYGVDLREVQFLAERAQARLMSCAMCAEVQYQYAENISLSKEDRDSMTEDEIRDADPRKVGRARDNFIIGVIFLNWTEPVEDDPKWPGKFQDPNLTNLKEPKDVSMRMGFGWIPSPTGEKSTKKKTWDNITALGDTLSQTCKSCLVDGAKTKDRDAHKLTITEVTCPECGSHWQHVIENDVTGTKEQITLDRDHAHQLEMDELRDLELVEGECARCKATVFPKVHLDCSSCDNPDPVQLSDVILSLQVCEIRHENGKSGGRYAEVSYVKNRSTGKFVHSRKDWENMSLLSSKVTKQDGVKFGSVGELYEHLNEIEDMQKFYFEQPMFGTDPDPVKQARLINAEGLPLHKKFE